MKAKLIGLLVIILFSSMTIQAKEKTTEFLVNGKCEMCKKRIEMAALSVAGVTKANWNVDTKTAVVTYDDSKTNLKGIHTAIAKVGHDTKMHKASDEAYNALPGCCKYDRSNLVAPVKPHRHEHK